MKMKSGDPLAVCLAHPRAQEMLDKLIVNDNLKTD